MLDTLPLNFQKQNGGFSCWYAWMPRQHRCTTTSEITDRADPRAAPRIDGGPHEALGGKSLRPVWRGHHGVTLRHRIANPSAAVPTRSRLCDDAYGRRLAAAPVPSQFRTSTMRSWLPAGRRRPAAAGAVDYRLQPWDCGRARAFGSAVVAPSTAAVPCGSPNAGGQRRGDHQQRARDEATVPGQRPRRELQRRSASGLRARAAPPVPDRKSVV